MPNPDPPIPLDSKEVEEESTADKMKGSSVEENKRQGKHLNK